MDVRVGGAWKAAMHLPDGSVKHWVGEFTEVDRPTRLALTLTDEPDEPDEPAGEPVTVDIVAVDNGAMMIMMQAADGFDDAAITAVTAGYTAFFDDMEKLLAR